ncbi:7-cyano-7-deazaguanine synthase [Halobacillus yeomjeoni]|uniref:7-cyano-7-deazaguanine synthase n=1 Tax=Halobacillus yeomjeoni TaxID=311194 RepID=A0A931HVS6_9BACI|nr:7-cyano-7-deazaguanine synthase [Halobacillus yeomjeoni]MBH0230702.1 7-cyano-7-deazaguanine synthase [Halobacillus yeomjeoni]
MANDVLWTGGWDSTYRVLNLVLDQKKTIQPYYVLDPVRPSTEMEWKTMEKIKRMMIEKDPSAEERILPTIKIKKEEIPENPEFTEEYKKLQQEYRLGDQYDWLGRYAESVDMDTLELSVHHDDKVQGMIENDVVKVQDGDDFYYKVVDEPSHPAFVIFKKYRFPLLEITKLEMEENAKKRGYAHIMEQTWFCHTPNKRGEPCGLCNPCKYTKDEGLGRRIPEPSQWERVRYFLFKVNRRLKKTLK